MPSLSQRMESAVIFVALLIAYQQFHFSWFLLILLVLIPDISMFGYFKNAKVGAVIYNIGHSYIIPVSLCVISIFMHWELGVMIAVIWGIHIAGDRAMGYGLKLPTGFKDTHLGRLR